MRRGDLSDVPNRALAHYIKEKKIKPQSFRAPTETVLRDSQQQPSTSKTLQGRKVPDKWYFKDEELAPNATLSALYTIYRRAVGAILGPIASTTQAVKDELSVELFVSPRASDNFRLLQLTSARRNILEAIQRSIRPIKEINYTPLLRFGVQTPEFKDANGNTIIYPDIY